MNTKDIYAGLGYGVPNQKNGTIHKPKYKEKGVKFMYIGIDEIREATKNLTPSGLKLYLYFAENEAGWNFLLSPKDFYYSYGVAESTYRKAKQELIDKGYIIEGERNHFDFYTVPQDKDISMEDLRSQLKKLGNLIRRYSEDEFQKICVKCDKIKDLPEKEKKQEGKKLLKEMQEEIKQLEKEDSTFAF